ncbi:MAG: putative two-component sensor kinase [Ilumatobacteraceae bacterium]|nr:putative two-component sensor kinase [Ilumatobacteraceae bacterium]
MKRNRPFRPLSGVRGRVVLTVLVVTACLYSLLGSIGFLHIASSGRDAIRERVSNVVDQLEAELRGGSGTVTISTPDGVEVDAVAVGADPYVPSDDIRVVRTVRIGDQDLKLVGHASQARLTDSLRSLYRGLWIGVPLAVVLTSVIAGLATRRALRPVSVITELAATIGAGDTTMRVPVPDTDDEIEQLARTVNEMLDRIAAGRTAQHQFTSDAAHELRTPMMALQGEIELALGAPATADVAFLRRLESLGDRLARRIDDLVLLSTLDEQPPLDRRPADLLAIARTEAAAMPAGDGAVRIDVADGAVPADVDARLIERALRNLIANACRHAASTVLVGTSSEDGTLWVHVDDDGPGIPPADRDAVLRRFGRLDEARHADAGGAGLGLAIVASVARAHGGSVVVTDSPLGGARVSMSVAGSADAT